MNINKVIKIQLKIKDNLNKNKFNKIMNYIKLKINNKNIKQNKIKYVKKTYKDLNR